MILEVSARCDIGLVRARNEDIILVGNELLRDCAATYRFDVNEHTQPLVIAVADGMGGHKGGAAASQLVATDMYLAAYGIGRDLNAEDMKAVLKEKMTEIHRRLKTEGDADTEKANMGSTMVGLLFYGASVFLINVGDSRMYRYRDGILSQFSRDHSLSAMTSNPEAPKNILMNSFGAGSQIFFDFDDITGRIIADDKLLLCSDGLTGELSDEEIELLLAQNATPDMLVDAAREKGARDNVSVVVINYNSGA
jgi:protein phosphatase